MEFKEYKLSELSKDNKGTYGIGASAVEYSKDLYTYLRITDIKEDGTLDYSNLKSVDDDNAKKYILEKGDIVFARTGNSTGKAYYYDGEIDNLVYAGFLIKFSLDKNKVNPRFIKYYTMTNEYKNWVKEVQTGSTRGNINEKMYGNMIIRLPPRDYQNKIIALLEKIDKKIELNKQINDNLYRIMQLYFDDWIDNLKLYEKSTLSRIANYKNGLAMQKFRPENEQGLPVIKIKEMNSGISNVTQRCSSNIDKNVIVNDGDVLFAWSGTLCMTIWCNGRAGLNQHIFKITSKKYPKWFYYFWTQRHLKKFIQIAAGKATTMGHIKRGELDLSEVLVPNDIELNRMNKTMEPMLNKYVSNKLENKNLEQLRDVLLPKLMNGEINVDKVVSKSHKKLH